jgi:stage II sporulation protein D
LKVAAPVPMGKVMVRRLTTLLAAVCTAAIMASPAQGATLFTQVGHGWGHGIGMSQWGAYGYAQHGWGYGAILTHYYHDVTLGPLGSSPQIRVLMQSGTGRMRFHADAGVTVVAEGDYSSHPLPAGDYWVEPGPMAGAQRVWSVTDQKFVLAGLTGSVRVAPQSSTPLRLDTATLRGYIGKHWRGSLRSIRNGSTVSIVNVVRLDGYINGILPCEVSGSWPIAAVRAQAVAGRSYAVATMRGTGDFDAYSDTRSQAYCPIESEGAGTADAVQATAGQVLRNGGDVITAFYSSSSGGRTSTLTASWGSSANPDYIVPVNDRYDDAGGANPNHTWPRVIYGERGLAGKFGFPNGRVSWVDHSIDGPSLRVLGLTLHFRNGVTASRTASQAFSSLGLKSTYFRLLGVTLNAPTRVAPGVRFFVTGRVMPKPLGSYVRLQSRVSGGAWLTAPDKVMLAADGTFSVRRHNGKDVSFRVVRPNAVSPVVHVNVAAATLPPAAAVARVR